MVVFVTDVADLSSSNSAVSLVNGTSLNCLRVGLIGPPYPGFGTIETSPAVSIDFSFHGPDTTCQSGLVS